MNIYGSRIRRWSLVALIFLISMPLFSFLVYRPIVVRHREQETALAIAATETSVYFLTNVPTSTPTITSTPTLTPTPTFTSTPTFTPTPSFTSTPRICSFQISKAITLYGLPSKAHQGDSITMVPGELVQLIGRLRDEPWWLLTNNDTKRGWAPSDGFSYPTECDWLARPEAALSLDYVVRQYDQLGTYKWQLLVGDTFSGFSYSWDNSYRQYDQSQAFLRLPYYSSPWVSRLNGQTLPDQFDVFLPFTRVEGKTDASPSGFVGVRFQKNDTTYFEVRLINTLECPYQYTIVENNKVVDQSPVVPMGENAQCATGQTGFLHLKVRRNNNLFVISGEYNDKELAEYRFDDNQLLMGSSFALVSQFGEVWFNFIVIAEPQ